MITEPTGSPVTFSPKLNENRINNNPQVTCILFHLKAMLSSPPSSVFLWGHVNYRHHVSYLKRRFCQFSPVYFTQFCTIFYTKHTRKPQFDIFHLSLANHLKGQLIGRLGTVPLDDVCSSNGRNVNGGLIMHQKMVPFVINLGTKLY